MYDILKDDSSSHSTDKIQVNKKRNLEIIIEERNSIKNPDYYKMHDSKTLPNFNNSNDIQNDNNRKSSFLKEKINQALEYSTKYRTLDPEDNIVNIDDDYLFDRKKKVGKKVNRNLKLLNLIKERMSQENNSSESNEIKKEEKKNDNFDIKKNKEIRKKEEDKINGLNLDKEKEKEKVIKDDQKRNIDEEKKNKLLNIINSKKYNKFQRIENKDEKKESLEKENNGSHNFNGISNRTKKSQNQNKSFRPYTAFYKKGAAPEENSFSIGEDSKQNQTQKEESNKYEKNHNISDKQKNRIAFNKRTKTIPTMNDIVQNLENGSNNISNINSNYNTNNDPSSKKGALKIVELLKMKKKEENDTRSKTEERQISKNEEKDEKPKYKHINKNMDSYGDKPIKKIEGENFRRNIEIVNSLPRKSFRDEEDESGDNYESYNRTQQYFRNSKKGSQNIIKSKRILNESDFENKSKKHFTLNNLNNNSNININKVNAPMKMNNNIYNNFVNNSKNFQKIERVNYHNPISIRSKFRQRLNNFNTITDNMIANINNSTNVNNNINIEQINSAIGKDIRTLDNSFDTMKTRKNQSKTMIGSSNSMVKNIYKPKRISNNNSPQKLNPYQKNTYNTENLINKNKNNSNLNFYSKIPKKKTKAYVKKSPWRVQANSNNSFIDTRGHTTKYSTKTKKIIRNRVTDNNNNNYSKIQDNNIDGNPYSILGLEGLNSSMDTYSTNRLDSINPSYSNYYNHNNSIIQNKNNINKMKTSKTIGPQRHPNNVSIIFNLEDLMVLEERLSDIGMALESNENIENKCFNFWNYYYNCSLYNLLEKIFKNKEDSNIIRLSINYELMSIMVCYEYSFDSHMQDVYLLLLELIDLNHNNLIIISEYILAKIVPENKHNVWVLKLQEIIKNSKIYGNSKFYKNMYFHNPMEKISFSINLIIKKLKNILLNYPTRLSDTLMTLLKKIDTKTYEEINDFFKEYILRIDNFEGSIMASSYLKKNKNFKSLPAPYLTYPPSKPYTLVLDLDETLVYFKIKSSKGGTLRARPYLFGFLEEMGHYYELIIWTSATEAYANSLIDAIEYDKKYFDYVLYREHAIIIGDDFVKDLTRIGRSLDRIIIIDDMPQNFRLQKENGITIKPFFGNDLDDSALYELVPILKHIAESGNDARIGLNKYRKEIVEKVTSNISKQKI